MITIIATIDETCICPFYHKYSNYTDGSVFEECGLDQDLGVCYGNIEKRPEWCRLQVVQE